MAAVASIKLASLSDEEAAKKLLLKKALPKIKHFESLGIPPSQFIHDVIDVLIHKDNISNRYEALSEADRDTLFEAFKLFVRQVLSLNLTDDQIVGDLASLGVATDYQKVIQSALRARWEEMRQTQSNNSVRLNKAHLVDFDWKLNLTVASDKIGSMKEPKLVLALYLKNDDEVKKELIVELSKSEVDEFIAQLEKANSIANKLRF